MDQNESSLAEHPRGETLSGWIVGSPPAHQLPAAPTFPREWLGQSIIHCFEQMAARDPERLIVDDGSSRYTYAELRRAMRQLAAQIDRESPAGRPVAALMYNDASFPALLLACVAAGRPIVAMDASDPIERQQAILAEAKPGAIVSVDPSIDLSFVDAGLVRIVAAPTSAEEVALPEVARDLDAPLGITFTSGSTGRPKGIAFSERQVLRIVAKHIDDNAIGPDDVILGIASLSAGGARESLCALLTGAQLHLVNLKRVGALASLRVMQEKRVTIFGFLPSPFRMLMQVPGIEASLAHLRAIDLVGEATTASDMALFRSKLPSSCRITLGLGSIDASLTCRWTAEDDKIDGLNAPVGYVDTGRCVMIADEAGNPVPTGEAGELIASDDGVSLGYWRAGRLDRETFRPGPGDPGPRTCHTGDVVRMREDGLIEFVGRRDRMVKVRGLRADLGEIEAAIRGMDEVADAVVVARARDGDSMHLAAFVSLAEGASRPDNATVRAVIARETAEHMVPHAIHFLDALPRLHNGKPDLVRLGAMAEEV